MASEVLVRLRGAPEDVLEELIREGYFNTKSEAVRAGIIELGKEYRIIGSPSYYREKLQKMMKKKKVSFAEAEKALKELEE